MQQKDVIYIDVEDDITAIIGKVKDAKQKIVALVPPKRTGVLQSAVNLKLLARAATNANKRLVIITGNAALGGLAASAEIPVAKSLNSRPELVKPSTASIDDKEVEDLIDGDNLDVGDHVDLKSKDTATDDDMSDTIDGIEIDGESTPLPAKSATPARKESAKRGVKVPDFGSFRKKAAIGGVVGVLFILFFYWANWIAPHATIVVSANTSGQSLSYAVTLGTDLESDVDQKHIKSIEQTLKDTQSVEFEATGKKNLGNKATGTIKFSQQSLAPTSISAGRVMKSSDGHAFVTNTAVTIPASSIGPGCFPTACPGTATVNVTAAEGGEDYNDISGSLSDAPAGVTATFNGTTSGGTDKMATVVSQSDIDKAKDQLSEANKDAALKKLKAKFGKDDVIIESSLTTTGVDPVSVPGVNQEATGGKAKLTREVTYTLTGVAKGEMNTYLDDAFDEMLTSKDSQRVYDNGLSTVNFSDFTAGNTGSTNDGATLTATAQIGPKINDNDIKEQAKGRRTGEVIGDIKAIDGVSDVNVKLSPFWVTSVPDDVKKISVEFKLKDNG